MAEKRKSSSNKEATPRSQPVPGKTQEPDQSPIPGHATEEQFRLLVESVVDYAIFLLDREGRIASWNRGAQRMKGYKADEIIGKHFSTFYTPEDIARNHPQEELEIAVRDCRYEEEGWRVRKDGTRFLANVVITALFDRTGEHCGFAKVTRDITERKRAEEVRLHRAEEQISRTFLRDILLSVTEGRLRFCDTEANLPGKLPTRGPSLDVTQTSLGVIRKSVLRAATDCGFPSERSQDLLTAVSEAAMNAAVHATEARCEIYSDCKKKHAMLQVWIRDVGSGIDLAHVHRATLERGFTTHGTLGHGFWLMLNTCDRIWLLTGTSGTTVVLEQDGQIAEPEWMGSRSYADVL
ncbi:MAG TPA: PAS domain S-box protein [Capsulimonadaceae bacterium]|nr:PAS domain S-box protein [Capsulimonadaceae bacterium]